MLFPVKLLYDVAGRKVGKPEEGSAMAKKLTWEEIKKQYDQEWVELVDYDWPDTDTYPHSGIVRVHAKTRREFDQLILQDPPEMSALVYVGMPNRKPGVILSANLHRVGAVHA